MQRKLAFQEGSAVPLSLSTAKIIENFSQQSVLFVDGLSSEQFGPLGLDGVQVDLVDGLESVRKVTLKHNLAVLGAG